MVAAEKREEGRPALGPDRYERVDAREPRGDRERLGSAASADVEACPFAVAAEVVLDEEPIDPGRRGIPGYVDACGVGAHALDLAAMPPSELSSPIQAR